MKKSSKGHTIKGFKEFCKYLLDNYIAINYSYNDSRIYYQLKEFYEKGTVKDVIYKNTKLDIKEEWLEETACRINEFYKHTILKSKINKIKTKIEDYEN